MWITLRCVGFTATAHRPLILSDDVLQVEEGSLYPALQRMLLKGWVTSKWGVTAGNRRARYYKLTADGRKQLATELSRYQRVYGAIQKVIQPA